MKKTSGFKMKGFSGFKKDKNKKSGKITRMDGLGNTEIDITKAFQNKNNNKKTNQAEMTNTNKKHNDLEKHEH